MIVGGGGAAIPPLESSGESILPSVVFPLSVIFPPCTNAGANIDVPPTDAATVPVAKTDRFPGRLFRERHF
jgi:hypothetical protein